MPVVIQQVSGLHFPSIRQITFPSETDAIIIFSDFVAFASTRQVLTKPALIRNWRNIN
jgi:hypothetical protein